MFSSSLYTDLYEITMARAFFCEGTQNTKASYSVYFRKLPFKGGFAVFCGTDTLLEMLENYSFSNEDIEFLREQNDSLGKHLFDENFLTYLSNLRLDLDIYAPKEGEVVFPYEPILRVEGSILQCQLIETLALNVINFQTLAATKAARIKLAAKGRSLSEFGLRRAQGLGGMWASRASYIGGFDSTSNVAAAKEYNIPASGTHAHSWVMAHESELDAFREYVNIFPGNSTLLIDTYNVESGIKNAIKVAHEMEERGERLSGVRIDSGDLTWQSRKVRRALDAEGLDYVKIILSNDLDEYKITSILEEGACVDGFGIGTKFACCEGHPNLGGVYKLNSLQNENGEWQDTMKISEQPEKTTIPGRLNVMRHYETSGYLAGDMIYDENEDSLTSTIKDPLGNFRQKNLEGLKHDVLLTQIMKDGKRTATWSTKESRDYARQSLDKIDYTHKRNVYPHIYPVGIESNLNKRRAEIIKSQRSKK